jgi:hypothetical protein
MINFTREERSSFFPECERQREVNLQRRQQLVRPERGQLLDLHHRESGAGTEPEELQSGNQRYISFILCN